MTVPRVTLFGPGEREGNRLGDNEKSAEVLEPKGVYSCSIWWHILYEHHWKIVSIENAPPPRPPPPQPPPPPIKVVWIAHLFSSPGEPQALNCIFSFNPCVPQVPTLPLHRKIVSKFSSSPDESQTSVLPPPPSTPRFLSWNKFPQTFISMQHLNEMVKEGKLQLDSKNNLMHPTAEAMEDLLPESTPLPPMKEYFDDGRHGEHTVSAM